MLHYLANLVNIKTTLTKLSTKQRNVYLLSQYPCFVRLRLNIAFSQRDQKPFFDRGDLHWFSFRSQSYPQITT